MRCQTQEHAEDSMPQAPGPEVSGAAATDPGSDALADNLPEKAQRCQHCPEELHLFLYDAV